LSGRSELLDSLKVTIEAKSLKLEFDSGGDASNETFFGAFAQFFSNTGYGRSGRPPLPAQPVAVA
jgi:hypothetical protein